jgi:CheY-like chemotaxis protein
MSHEFRTPLNSIISLSQMLQSELDGPLSDEQRKQATFIRGAAQSLSETVNDLLDIAKIEAGKVALRIGEFDLRDVFTALRGMFRPQLASGAVSLELNLPPEGTTMISDEGKLTQILRNLLSNALKYTERGSVRVSFDIGEERIAVSVSDTGIGIPPDYLEAIFQEFVQVDNTLQRRVKGTGLGLSLSRRLAHLLGGGIEVVSELGAGSTFTVDIPRYLEAPAEVEVHTATAGRAAGEVRRRSSTALLVDDEDTARYVLRSLLPEKIAVIEASSGAEALEKLRSATPDFVVLDVAMPAMDGFEVARRLRASDRTASIPLIFYTSLELADGQKEEASRLGIPVVSKTQPSRDVASARLKRVLSELGLLPTGAE